MEKYLLLEFQYEGTLLNIISLNYTINLFLFMGDVKIYDPAILNTMEGIQRFLSLIY